MGLWNEYEPKFRDDISPQVEYWKCKMRKWGLNGTYGGETEPGVHVFRVGDSRPPEERGLFRNLISKRSKTSSRP